MVDFGLIEEWQVEPGRLVSWGPSAASAEAAAQAPVSAIPPSHMQENHLRSAHRSMGADFRTSPLFVATATMPGKLDRDALTRAINAFLLRHDTFRSWFAVTDGEVRRHVVPTEVIDFVPTDYGQAESESAIHEHVQRITPGPLQWDCFSFGAIERDAETTFYLAVDHLNTDGVAQYLSAADLAQLYVREVAPESFPRDMLPAASYLEYCERERNQSATLTAASPGVRKWIELVRGNDGQLPTFPLGLGPRTPGGDRSAQLTISIFDEAAALAFEKVCIDSGAEFTGGIFAAAARTERQLADTDYYFTMAPISVRSVAELGTIGWFVNLVPVAFPIGFDASFTRLASSAQRAWESGRALRDTPVHRALEIAGADPSLNIPASWGNPMVSYIDARDVSGNEFFSADIEVGAYANRSTAADVLIWINRFESETTLSVIFPDNPVAAASVQRYTTAMRQVFREVAGVVES